MGVTADTTTPADRLVAALADPDYLFTRDQLVFLMAEAARWAREADDSNWPREPVHVLGKWYDQAEYRQRCDAKARKPRPGDWPGWKHGGRLPRAWQSEWCGDHGTHRPHTVRTWAERFRCKGR